MRLFAVVAALAASADAFKHTSPFLLFSSSPLSSRYNSSFPQVKSSEQVAGDVREMLGECREKVYLITQASEPAAAYGAHTKAAAGSASVKGRYVQEVVGGDVLGELEKYEELCGGKVERVNLEGDDVVYDDVLLQKQVFSQLPNDYTVIYATTPRAAKTQQYDEETRYQADFQEPVHMDLRRQLVARVPKETKTNDTRPLFEKYQFFTPGIFMGLLVSIVMLALLGVGLNAISGLQVSYAAFDKEMGPAAQKKA